MRKKPARSANSVLVVLSTIFLLITLVYAAVKFQNVIQAEQLYAKSPVGDFVGVCEQQQVKDLLYAKYETFDNTIEFVDFYINDNKIRTEQLYPYSLGGNVEDNSQTLLPHDLTSLPDGEHTLKAVIRTPNQEYTDTLKFQVANDSGQNTFNQFIGVCDEQTVYGQLYIHFMADPQNTNKVEFSLTGPNNYNFNRTETSYPYALNGNYDQQSTTLLRAFNTSNLPEGEYRLTAKVYDRANQLSEKTISFTKSKGGSSIPDNPNPSPTSEPVASPAASQTPRPSNSSNPTSTPQPTHNHPPTNPPSSGSKLPFAQVDPRSTTDNQVNSFIKEILRNSDPTKVLAAGSWWGPTDQFFVNQLWTINRTAEIGKVHTGNSQSTNMTCFLPGIDKQGLSKNFLGDPRNSRNQTAFTQTHFGVRSDGISSTRRGVSGNRPGNWVTNISPLPSGYSSFELRVRCESKEGASNLFGDGAPILNDDLRTVMGIGQWRGSEGTPQAAQFNHANLSPMKYASINARGWYTKEGYVHLNIDGATQIHNGRTTNLSNKDLLGAKIRGKLRVRGTGHKGGNNPSLGVFLRSTQMPIHHLELRIEDNNEDYTVDRKISTSTSFHRQWTEFELDTTLLTEGWHILSYHTHAIDKGNSAPYRDKQLAVEFKIPICVDNDERNDCPFPTGSSGGSNTPTQTTPPSTGNSGSNLITSGVNYNNDSSANISSSRNASVRVPENLLNPRQGWLATRIKMGFSSTTSFSSDPIIFDLSESDPRDHFLYFDAATDQFHFARNYSNGGNTLSSASQTFSSGSTKTIIAAWTATELKISIDGGTFKTQTNSSIPNQSTLYIGSTAVQGNNRQINSDFYWVAGGTGTLNNTDAQKIHSFGNADQDRNSFPGSANFIWEARSNQYNNR